MIKVHLLDRGGVSLPDSMVDGWVDSVIETSNFFTDYKVEISQALIFTAIRVRVKQGIIPADYIEFHRDGKVYKIEPDGSFCVWPDGWGEHNEKYLVELL